MAKTAPLKRGSKPISVRSRSAKRATSPSINLDKTLKLAKPPPSSTNYHPSVLSAHPDGGVSKRNKKGKQISRQQRRRQEKGIERAEAVIDKTDKKLNKSIGKQRVINSRRAAWDELNERISTTEDPKSSVDHQGISEDQDAMPSPKEVPSDRVGPSSPKTELVPDIAPPANAEEDEIL